MSQRYACFTQDSLSDQFDRGAMWAQQIHHFNASDRVKACATVQLLNRRNEKFKRTRKVRAHILVVDDDPMACMTIEIYLQRNNFGVKIADGEKWDFARSSTNSST